MANDRSLIDQLNQKTKLSREELQTLFVSLGHLVARRLLEGERIAVPAVGSLQVRRSAARRVADLHHPGRTIVIPAQNQPKFTVQADLKKALPRLTAREVASLRSVARPINVGFIDLSAITIPKPMLNLLPERMLRRYQFVPVEADATTIRLAMVDPENREAIELVKKATLKKVIPLLTTQADLARVLDQTDSGTAELAELAQEAEDTIVALPAEKADDNVDESAALEHAPAAKLMSQLLRRAVREQASDIHIEPSDDTTEIRLRVDGILRHVAKIPRSIHAGLIARLKVLTNLRLDEHRLPQDGRFRTMIDHGEIDFRVSFLPTVAGEKVVVRILDKSAGILTLNQLGLRGTAATTLEEEIHKPHGMILVTGPTGSGKTTTLYAVIDRLRSPTTNITTLEDPVEYRLLGINQSQVNSDIGYTFAAGLRSILRQDPNIVLVGEIRDQETAAIAVHAALTGHIVLSTLHTNDAAGAIPRLIDMGIEPFLIMSSLNAVVAQRLVRKICAKCKAARELTTDHAPDVLREVRFLKIHPALTKNLPNMPTKLSHPVFYAGRGCAACDHTGYKGRFGIYEIFPITPTIRPLVVAQTNADTLAAAAIHAGMVTLRQDGVLKALDGLTTIEEVWRVTKT